MVSKKWSNRTQMLCLRWPWKVPHFICYTFIHLKDHHHEVALWGKSRSWMVIYDASFKSHPGRGVIVIRYHSWIQGHRALWQWGYNVHIWIRSSHTIQGGGTDWELDERRSSLIRFSIITLAPWKRTSATITRHRLTNQATNSFEIVYHGDDRDLTCDKDPPFRARQGYIKKQTALFTKTRLQSWRWHESAMT